MEEWITTLEAVKLSGYHPDTIRELLRGEKILGQKFGPVWQVNKSSLIEFMQIMEEKGEKRGPKPYSSKSNKATF